ncbi:hypothetical protein [Desulfitobacterium chlororespirans]|uniref:Uncharacterized protein n=1 Tax=Desulfitobacterium chlororespirans DSM 11544 TaxID=1121395 RepID=A0A1M7TIH6_9FIRM|nr:hypothetical protein [Desulfitobacterium chlororespirans]SHN70520.1 hypothetical protein SAMN02745215_02091 [Desulfitobacterium chlororespirans DSM 11544]
MEYVKGIAVIKAFHMHGDKAKRIKDTIGGTCRRAITYEETFVVPNSAYQLCFSFGVAVMVFLIVVRYLYGSIGLPVTMMLLVYASFPRRVAVSPIGDFQACL